jgi:hypothetical protein
MGYLLVLVVRGGEVTVCEDRSPAGPGSGRIGARPSEKVSTEGRAANARRLQGLLSVERGFSGCDVEPAGSRKDNQGVCLVKKCVPRMPRFGSRPRVPQWKVLVHRLGRAPLRRGDPGKNEFMETRTEHGVAVAEVPVESHVCVTDSLREEATLCCSRASPRGRLGWRGRLGRGQRESELVGSSRDGDVLVGPSLRRRAQPG